MPALLWAPSFLSDAVEVDNLAKEAWLELTRRVVDEAQPLVRKFLFWGGN